MQLGLMNEDLILVGRDLRNRLGFTLCSIVRNEIFFIPNFLDHYRLLGVERFLIIDDQSTDGTREYLLNEPDVMVLESPHRFGDYVDVPDALTDRLTEFRAKHLWRKQLMDIAGAGRTHLQLDVDEFLQLPAGASVQDLEKRLATDPYGMALGVMLDVYPRSPNDLKKVDSLTSSEWFFDSVPHLKLRENKRPKSIYGGARARLYDREKLLPKQKFKTWVKSKTRIRGVPNVHMLFKPILVNWRSDDNFVSSHEMTRFASNQILLPLFHYKFCPPIFEKISSAISEGNYFNGSEDYQRMLKLMQNLSNMEDGFMGKDSAPLDGYKSALQSGNALGF